MQDLFKLKYPRLSSCSDNSQEASDLLQYKLEEIVTRSFAHWTLSVTHRHHDLTHCYVLHLTDTGLSESLLIICWRCSCYMGSCKRKRENVYLCPRKNREASISATLSTLHSAQESSFPHPHQSCCWANQLQWHLAPAVEFGLTNGCTASQFHLISSSYTALGTRFVAFPLLADIDEYRKAGLIGAASL